MQEQHKRDARHVQIYVEALVHGGRHAVRQHLRHRHRDAQDDDDLRVQQRQCGTERIVADAPVLLALPLGALTVATAAATVGAIGAAIAGQMGRMTVVQCVAGGVRVAAVPIVLRLPRVDRPAGGRVVQQLKVGGVRRFEGFVAAGQLVQGAVGNLGCYGKYLVS